MIETILNIIMYLFGIVFFISPYIMFFISKKYGLKDITFIRMVYKCSNYEKQIDSLEFCKSNILKTNLKNLQKINRDKSKSSLLEECNNFFAKYDSKDKIGILIQNNGSEKVIKEYNKFITKQKQKIKD